jgi:hypothetical protein
LYITYLYGLEEREMEHGKIHREGLLEQMANEKDRFNRTYTPIAVWES